MTNINTPQIEYFASFADEITSKFRRLSNLVKHPTSSGDYHEEILRTVLRNFLSRRFSVKKGFIYAGHDLVSEQIDLMVIDEGSPMTYVFQEGDFAIVIPEAVVAVMEIKTVLQKGNFIEALRNIFSAKSLMINPLLPANLVGIIFGYEGVQDDTLGGWFQNQEFAEFKNNEVMAPEAIMFFTQSNLLVRGNQFSRPKLDERYYYQLIGGSNEIKQGMNSQASQISFLLQMIINMCRRRESMRTGRLGQSSFNLVQEDRIALTNKRFTFVDGVSEFDIPQ
ncbi:MAG: DUF6602 domain-containing protein [Patescibacteria group bacterium]